MAQDFFRFGSGSKFFTRQNENNLARKSSKSRSAICPISVPLFQDTAEERMESRQEKNKESISSLTHSTQASLLSESALLLRTVVIGESAERTTIGKKSIDHSLQSVAHFFATVMSNRIAQFAAG